MNAESVMGSVMQSVVRRWLEVLLPVYAVALIVVWFRAEYTPTILTESMSESPLPGMAWAVVGALTGILGLWAVIVTFFLLYSPFYLLGKLPVLWARGAGWTGGKCGSTSRASRCCACWCPSLLGAPRGPHGIRRRLRIRAGVLAPARVGHSEGGSAPSDASPENRVAPASRRSNNLTAGTEPVEEMSARSDLPPRSAGDAGQRISRGEVQKGGGAPSECPGAVDRGRGGGYPCHGI